MLIKIFAIFIFVQGGEKDVPTPPKKKQRRSRPRSLKTYGMSSQDIEEEREILMREAEFDGLPFLAEFDKTMADGKVRKAIVCLSY